MYVEELGFIATPFKLMNSPLMLTILCSRCYLNNLRFELKLYPISTQYEIVCICSKNILHFHLIFTIMTFFPTNSIPTKSQFRIYTKSNFPSKTEFRNTSNYYDGNFVRCDFPGTNFENCQQTTQI